MDAKAVETQFKAIGKAMGFNDYGVDVSWDRRPLNHAAVYTNPVAVVTFFMKLGERATEEGLISRIHDNG